MTMHRNLILLCAIRALLMTLFPVAIITLFWKYELGMSMTQIMVLQAIFGLIVALFEFSGGYIADRIGYRRSLIIGLAIMTLGWCIYIFSQEFYQAVVAEIILGIGITFVSGTDRALMYESLKSFQQEHLFTKWVGRSVFAGQFAEGSAALVAGVLYAYWSRLPFVLEVFVMGLACLLAFFLVENRNRTTAIQQNHFENVKEILLIVFVKKTSLRWTMLLASTFGLASFYPVWLVQLYAKESGIDTVYLGLLWAVANYVVALGALMSYKIESRYSIKTIIQLCVSLIFVGYLGLGFSTLWWGVLFYYCLTLMRGINGPILEHEINKKIPSEHRSAILSIKSFLVRGIFACTGPAIGVLTDSQGFHMAFIVIGTTIVLLSITLFWLWQQSLIDHQDL